MQLSFCNIPPLLWRADDLPRPSELGKGTALYFTASSFVLCAVRPVTLVVPFSSAGHLASSIVVHMLCNYMGVPDITFSIAPGNPRESTRTSVLYEHRIGERWYFLVVHKLPCMFEDVRSLP